MNDKKTDTDRRKFLTVAATAGAATAVAACSGSTPLPDAGMDADIALLNALLAAEYKAIDAYTQGAAVLVQDPSALGQRVLAVAVEFQKDHKEHAVLLYKPVTALGGTPVTEGANKFT